MTELSSNPSPPFVLWVIRVVTVVASCVLLFTNLGDRPLWDDEAITAMTSANVWATGDTGVRFGHNLVLYRNGLLMEGLLDRYTPPLQFYLTAPFVGRLGHTAMAARLPFAICGLLTVLLILRWTWKARAGVTMSLLIGLATLGNVSLFLFARTCRYYALTTLLSLAVAYFYVHFDRSRRTMWALLVTSVLLLTSNYLAFVALWVCIGVDFALFGRNRVWPSGRNMMTLVVAHLIVGAAVVYVWNPVGKVVLMSSERSWFTDRLMLFWWTVRDINRCEFAVVLLVMIAPLVAWWRGRRELLAGFVAFMTYVGVIGVLSPQNLTWATDADVRYLTALIPLGIALGAAVVHDVVGGRLWPALVVGVLAFGTNLLNGTAFTSAGPRSTAVSFARELVAPLPDPYSATIKWVNENVKFGQTVWVTPDYRAYPLMYHAPHALYAWQLREPVKPALAPLPGFNFMAREAPDFVIEFGPKGAADRAMYADAARVVQGYEKIATIDAFYKDEYRPELIWHRFKPRLYDRATEAIYVYAKRP